MNHGTSNLLRWLPRWLVLLLAVGCVKAALGFSGGSISYVADPTWGSVSGSLSATWNGAGWNYTYSLSTSLMGTPPYSSWGAALYVDGVYRGASSIFSSPGSNSFSSTAAPGQSIVFSLNSGPNYGSATVVFPLTNTDPPPDPDPDATIERYKSKGFIVTNLKNVDQVFEASIDGVVLYEKTLQPGERDFVQIEGAEFAPVLWKGKVQGEIISTTGGEAIQVNATLPYEYGTFETAFPVTTITQTSSTESPATVPQVRTVGGGSAPPSSTSQAPTPTESSVEWKPSTDTTTATGLDKQTFKEGTAAVVNKLEQIRSEAKDRGVAEEADRQEAQEDREYMRTLRDERPSTATMGSSGASAGSAESGALTTGLGSPGAISEHGGSSPLFLVSSGLFPAAINVNPFSGGRFAGIAAACRYAAQWFLMAGLAYFLVKGVGEWSSKLSQVQQAKGNTVFAGTGAQATALIAAGLITVAIGVGIAGLVSWSFSGLSISSVVSGVAGSPFSGFASTAAEALFILEAFFPLTTLAVVIAARVSFGVWAPPVFAVAAAVVRFVVP